MLYTYKLLIKFVIQFITDFFDQASSTIRNITSRDQVKKNATNIKVVNHIDTFNLQKYFVHS